MERGKLPRGAGAKARRKNRRAAKKVNREGERRSKGLVGHPWYWPAHAPKRVTESTQSGNDSSASA